MNWFDLLILIIILASLLRGAISGLVMQLASLAGVVFGAIFAGQLSDYLAPRIIKFVGGSPHIIGVLSYIIAFLLIFVGMFLIGKAMQSAVEAMKMNSLNRLTGAVFCSLKWLVLTSIILNLLVELDQGQHLIKEDVREQTLSYPTVLGMARMVVPYLRFEWIQDMVDEYQKTA